MNRQEALSKESDLTIFGQIKALHDTLDTAFLSQYSRSLPLADTLLDRWERAKKLGFGDGTSIYDSCMVIGEVTVGKNCWIRPNTLLDGSGRLQIGDHCTLSTGVQIYTHDNVRQTLSAGKIPIVRESTTLGDCVYVAPNVVIARGVTIGPHSVIAVGSFVNKSFESNKILAGQPAKCIGEVIVTESAVEFKYY